MLPARLAAPKTTHVPQTHRISVRHLRRTRLDLHASKPTETLDNCGTVGLWLARALHVRLAGIDISPVAIAQAAQRAHRFMPPGRATFHVGTLAATGLPDACADGFVCVDALGLVPDKRAALQEIRRVLRPGARAIITAGATHHPISSRPWPHEGLTWATQPDTIRAICWWTLAELRTTSETVYPGGLGDLVARLLSNGTPAKPVTLNS